MEAAPAFTNSALREDIPLQISGNDIDQFADFFFDDP